MEIMSRDNGACVCVSWHSLAMIDSMLGWKTLILVIIYTKLTGWLIIVLLVSVTLHENTHQFINIYKYFSDSPWYRSHRQVTHAGVWVSWERPEAVHGRLRRHPGHEQCQAFPLPGKQNTEHLINSLNRVDTIGIFHWLLGANNEKKHLSWVLCVEDKWIGYICILWPKTKGVCLLLCYIFIIWIFESLKVLYYRTLYPNKKKTIFPHYCDCPHWQQWSPLDWAEADHNTVLQSGWWMSGIVCCQLGSAL